MTPGQSDGPDSRAVAVARQLRDSLDAECVILFGSRPGAITANPQTLILSSSPDTNRTAIRKGLPGELPGISSKELRPEFGI